MLNLVEIVKTLDRRQIFMDNIPIILIAIPSVLIPLLAVYVLLRRRRSHGTGPKPLTVGLATTRERLTDRLSALFGNDAPGDEFWSELEATLIEADVGINVTSKLLDSVSHERNTAGVRQKLSDSMLEVLRITSHESRVTDVVPHVILIVGVNGVGKTTTIAKLAKQYLDGGRRVLLVAGDTFRAAAVEQLKIWGERLKVDVVAQATGADSAAVCFDGVTKARAKGYDVVIIDTAGRLHTKHNLMEELKKIGRVIDRAMPGAPHERLVVLDATIGSNGLVQARQFNEVVNLTGAIVTKLDGTAKGGVVFAVAGELGIPVTHIGIGEGMDDLRPFDPVEFVHTILP